MGSEREKKKQTIFLTPTPIGGYSFIAQHLSSHFQANYYPHTIFIYLCTLVSIYVSIYVFNFVSIYLPFYLSI